MTPFNEAQIKIIHGVENKLKEHKYRWYLELLFTTYLLKQQINNIIFDFRC